MHLTGTVASALLLAASTLVGAETCAKCDLEAHGFASLNGGTTGGKGGRIVTAKKLDQLIEFAAAKEPLIIRIDGMIKAKPFGFEVPVASHKTIIGVGAKSGIVEGGLNINRQQNIIIRNLNIHGTYDGKTNWAGKLGDYDAIQIDNSTNIWIDGNHLYEMGDGLIDLRRDTDFVTVSKNRLENHNKALGIGWTPNVIAKVTMNDNFFHSTNVRNPSADNLKYGHLYNNYYRNLTGYGNYARGQSQLLIETSYFEDVFDPIVAGPGGRIKTNWVKFKRCEGEIHLDVQGETVFQASSFYNYTLANPYDIPVDIPYNAGPKEAIGV
ncbi:polysaccharide lyase family 1 protein [Parathielavia hyrcaniae]|uniref:Polysaccharide lyase family 1 protein n=1 Tax=Parathielavia hyrcaniae TaxID=113614 RepID=A0AAN6Q3Z1_9PEZI|nr:polysaccharide lyase family 1 protein [Parathielavia hyrcaniae]